MSSRPPLCVVLVEPSGPLNVGSVARLCANFGITDLRLVAPRCDPRDPDAQRMAVHGQSVLETARVWPDLISALADCRRVVATCGRLDHGDIPLHPPEVVLPWLLGEAVEANAASHPVVAPAALVFGREDRGLSNDELLLSQRVIQLHSHDSYPSMNLSHAVAVVLHELESCWRTPPASLAHPSADPLVTAEALADHDPAAPTQLDACMKDAEALLLEVGFLLEHTAHARMAKVRGLLQRALIRREEVALIRGMVRQLRWAIQQRRS